MLNIQVSPNYFLRFFVSLSCLALTAIPVTLILSGFFKKRITRVLVCALIVVGIIFFGANMIPNKAYNSIVSFVETTTRGASDTVYVSPSEDAMPHEFTTEEHKAIPVPERTEVVMAYTIAKDLTGIVYLDKNGVILQHRIVPIANHTTYFSSTYSESFKVIDFSFSLVSNNPLPDTSMRINNPYKTPIFRNHSYYFKNNDDRKKYRSIAAEKSEQFVCVPFETSPTQDFRCSTYDSNNRRGFSS